MCILLGGDENNKHSSRMLSHDEQPICNLPVVAQKQISFGAIKADISFGQSQASSHVLVTTIIF